MNRPTYVADVCNVVLVFPDGERRHAAICEHPQYAQVAAERLNRARVLNDFYRRYTAAARLIAQVEALPGFEWIADST